MTPKYPFRLFPKPLTPHTLTSFPSLPPPGAEGGAWGCYFYLARGLEKMGGNLQIEPLLCLNLL